MYLPRISEVVQRWRSAFFSFLSLRHDSCAATVSIGGAKKKGQEIQTGVVLSRSCCGKSCRGGGADTLAIELRCSDGNECRLWWTEIEVHGCTAPVVYLVKAKQVFLRIYQHGVVLMRIAIAWP